MWLIIGARSCFARDLFLTDTSFVGVDQQEKPEWFPKDIPYYQINYEKRGFEDIFKKYKFQGLIHFGRMRPTQVQKTSVRIKQNIFGTKIILELAKKYELEKVIVLSTHSVYGALKDNPLYIKENAPLRGIVAESELLDSIEMDHEACEFLYHYPHIKTVVLRPVHRIGPHIISPLMSAINANLAPLLIGFDPLIQTMYQNEFIEAIQKVMTANQPESGVYNVASSPPIHLSDFYKKMGKTPTPLPKLFFPALFKLVNQNYPSYFESILKYPVIVDDTLFRKNFGL